MKTSDFVKKIFFNKSKFIISSLLISLASLNTIAATDIKSSTKNNAVPLAVSPFYAFHTLDLTKVFPKFEGNGMMISLFSENNMDRMFVQSDMIKSENNQNGMTYVTCKVINSKSYNLNNSVTSTNSVNEAASQTKDLFTIPLKVLCENLKIKFSAVYYGSKVFIKIDSNLYNVVDSNAVLTLNFKGLITKAPGSVN